MSSKESGAECIPEFTSEGIIIINLSFHQGSHTKQMYNITESRAHCNISIMESQIALKGKIIKGHRVTKHETEEKS